jgi:hypothetical protein
VDSLIVVWPDKRFQVLTNVPANQFLTVSQANAAGRYSFARPADQPLFTDVSTKLAPAYKHHENTFFDYGREPLMPHLLSTEGPALAVGDVNGDGRDDLYAVARNGSRAPVQQGPMAHCALLPNRRSAPTACTRTSTPPCSTPTATAIWISTS